MKKTQRGMTMVGFLITLCVVIFFAFCAMKIVPMYLEFYSVKQALKGIADDATLAGASKDAIRTSLVKRLDMSYSSHVKPKEALKFEYNNGNTTLVVDYERRESLFMNLDVVGKFRAEQALTRGIGGN